MSTDPETTETSPSEDTGTDAGEGAEGTAPEGTEGTGEDPAAQDTDGTGEAKAEAAAPELSEAAAELLAQKLERERIERRKAEKAGPIVAGTKLSGTAADLLAAVRAVESGEKPVTTPFAKPEPTPRRSAAPEAVRLPQPVPAEPGAPATETVESVRLVLAEGGAPETLAAQVAAALGESGDDQLREDPWQLLRVPGVRPEQADGFARALLGAECAPDDERRGRAVVGWLLEQAALAGHTALEASALTAALAKQGVPDPDAATQSAIAEGEVLVFQDALDEPAVPVQRTDDASEEDTEAEERPVRVLIGLERYALAEESLADGLAKLINSVPKEDGSAADWEQAGAAKGSTGELIRAVAGHGLVLHTGGEASLEEPAALLRAAAGFGLRAWAAAHSPVGRDRFAALLTRNTQSENPPSAESDSPAPDDGPRAATVAGLLSGAEGPGRDADGALDLDLLVVLDAPQLDVETAALVSESLPDGARLVLAGDPAVLWSAGAGRVFADLLASKACPQVVSRRPDLGPVGELVSGIGIGELNQVEAPGKEVVIVPVRDAGEAVHRTVQLVADSVPRVIGVPAEQTVVITPGHGGAAGDPCPQRGAEGAAQPRPRPLRRLRPRRPDRVLPRPGPYGSRPGGERRRRGAAPGVRRRPRRRTEGAGRAVRAARVGADRAPGGGGAVARGGRGAAGGRGAGAQPAVGVHGVQPGRSSPLRGARRGPGAAPGRRRGPGQAADDPVAGAAAAAGPGGGLSPDGTDDRRRRSRRGNLRDRRRRRRNSWARISGPLPAPPGPRPRRDRRPGRDRVRPRPRPPRRCRPTRR